MLPPRQLMPINKPKTDPPVCLMWCPLPALPVPNGPALARHLISSVEVRIAMPPGTEGYYGAYPGTYIPPTFCAKATAAAPKSLATHADYYYPPPLLDSWHYPRFPMADRGAFDRDHPFIPVLKRPVSNTHLDGRGDDIVLEFSLIPMTVPIPSLATMFPLRMSICSATEAPLKHTYRSTQGGPGLATKGFARMFHLLSAVALSALKANVENERRQFALLKFSTFLTPAITSSAAFYSTELRLQPRWGMVA